MEAPLSAADLFLRKRRFCVENEERTAMQAASENDAGKSLINNFFIAPKVSFARDFGGVMISLGIKCYVYLHDKKICKSRCVTITINEIPTLSYVITRRKTKPIQ